MPSSSSQKKLIQPHSSADFNSYVDACLSGQATRFQTQLSHCVLAASSDSRLLALAYPMQRLPLRLPHCSFFYSRYSTDYFLTCSFTHPHFFFDLIMRRLLKAALESSRFLFQSHVGSVA